MAVPTPTIGFVASPVLPVHTPEVVDPGSESARHVDTDRGAAGTTSFPRNNTRHRVSNINVKDPEKEFLDTAVKACRSTIAQQEVELKRLKENLDIRNKRISQLENQVSEAAKHVADRNPQQYTPDGSAQDKIEKAINLILSKLDNHKTAQDIIINNNQNGVSSRPCHVSQYTQTEKSECNECTFTDQTGRNLRAHIPPYHTQDAETEYPTYSCGTCSHVCETEEALRSHITSHHHTHSPNSQFSQTCSECGRKFSCINHLVEHTESEHAGGQVVSCTYCSYKCKSETHLADHIEALHMEPDRSPAVKTTL